jgi:non-heme chloroperoxidase
MNWSMMAATAALSTAAAAAPSSITEARVPVAEGVSLHVEAAGKPSDVTVVFIPGWGMTANIWDAQMRRLATTQRVVAFDPRSQGRSSIVPHGVTPERRAADLEALLEALRIEKAVLVGWSQGVQDIGAYTLRFGTKRIAGVVLVDGAFSHGAAGVVSGPKEAAFELRMANVFAAAPEAYAEGMVGAIFAKPLTAVQKAQIVYDVLSTPPAIGAAAMLASNFGADRSGAAAKLDRPVLVVAAGRSPQLAEQQAMARTMPDARLEVVDKAGHGIFIDEPERFASLLRDFLNRLRAKPRTRVPSADPQQK